MMSHWFKNKRVTSLAWKFNFCFRIFKLDDVYIRLEVSNSEMFAMPIGYNAY